jgi:hypothetical protein
MIPYRSVLHAALPALPALRALHGLMRTARAVPWLLACLLVVACTAKDTPAEVVVPEVVPTELYVAPDGQDANPGTRAAPLRSLARAAQLVTPGAIVNVLPGTYQGGFRTTVDGRPNARIVFRSTERWRARIVPPTVSTGALGWDNRASFVDIEGFDLDGSTGVDGPEASAGLRWTTGIYSAGSHDRIVGNHVHHVAVTVPCTNGGGSGIVVDSYARGTNAEVTGNSVHDIGPPGCRWVQGINVNTPAVVRNNVLYRIAAAGIHLWHDAHDVVVANNTVTTSDIGLVVGAGDFYHTNAPNDHTQVVNNIVFDNRIGISEQGVTGPNNTYRNNLVFGNPDGNWHLADGMAHSGTVASEPKFVTYTRDGTPNFRLTAESPAIGKGLADGTTTPDFDGKPRPAQDAVDIGAFQH